MLNHSELLGKRIKELRLARGLSHEEVAKELGLSQGAISQWETGKSSPKGKNRKALANMLGVSEASLFSESLPELQPAREPTPEEILEIFIRGSAIAAEKKDILRAIVRATDEELFGISRAAAPVLLRLAGSNKNQASG